MHRPLLRVGVAACTRAQRAHGVFRTSREVPRPRSRLLYQEEIMDEHLAAWQIAEFILGCLDEDELEEVYRPSRRVR